MSNPGGLPARAGFFITVGAVRGNPSLSRHDFTPSGVAALRTPTLPFSVLVTPGSFGAPISEEAWKDRRAEERDLLLERLRDPVIREAVFLASPDLEERIPSWEDDPESESGRRVEVALYKYVTRMASRCTPFGLFAANTVARVGRTTHLALAPRASCVRSSRIDMEFLDAAIEKMADDPALRPVLPFRTNTSLYRLGATLRYAEPRTVRGQRAYFLVDVEADDVLLKMLATARGGALLEDVARVAVDAEVSLADAYEFAEELVAARLLVPHLGPVVTGEDATDFILHELRSRPAARPIVDTLGRVRDALRSLDKEGLGHSPQVYRELMDTAKALGPVEPARFVQVDLIRPGDSVTVANSVVDELLKAAHVLLDLFSFGRRDPLSDFRTRFEERYGDAMVPLVEALDEETGIGYQTAQGPAADASPLIAGLPFPDGEDVEEVAWGSRGRYLLRKTVETLTENRPEMVLEPAELRVFEDPDVTSLADAIHVHASLLEPDGENGAWAVFDSAGGPSGARLLGRFSHADPLLRDGVDEHVRDEEALAPDVCFVELVHLPEGRTGNILARPLLRRYELEYLGTSGAPRDQVLHIDDLWVRVRDGAVVLWSRSLGCEVRPRLTSAHNTQYRSLGLYRFLSALQAQGRVEGVSWSWGPLESLPKLPRVRFGRVILTPAVWRLRKQEIESLRGNGGFAAFRRVQEWRKDHELPRWIGLVDMDNVLTCDLDSPLSVASFLHALRGQSEAQVRELFPGSTTAVVEGPEGVFLNEVVVPVVRSGKNAAKHQAATGSSEPTERRAVADGRKHGAKADDVGRTEELGGTEGAVRSPGGLSFLPGSEWLSAKIYSGVSTSDVLLTDWIAPLTSQLLQAGAIESWFFLRYADPDWHLRVRFRGSAERLRMEALSRLEAAMRSGLELGLVHRVEIDTYQPETARYGGESYIVAAEEIFHHDSEFVAGVVAGNAGDDGLDTRWRVAAVAMDRLLRDFGYGVDEKLRLTQQLSDHFALEFREDSDLRKALRDRYRQERRAIESWLDGASKSSEEFAEAMAGVEARSESMRPAIERYLAGERAGRLSTSLDEIVASFLHMHVNRVLRGAQRAQEMVLYRFLAKTYESRQARARAQAKGRAQGPAKEGRAKSEATTQAKGGVKAQDSKS